VNGSWLIHAALVGVGGFLGSVLRFGVSGLVHRYLPSAAFPYGTLTVNVLGCLAIGLLAGLTDARQVLGPGARLFLFLGLLGGFTTFSTFGYETVALLKDAERWRATMNIALHLGLGLSAVWAGYALSRAW
jgi:CrcB protein